MAEPTTSATWWWSARGRRAWRPRSTRRRRGSRSRRSTRRPPAGRPGPARRSRTTWASPPGSPAGTWPTGRRSRPRSSARGWPTPSGPSGSSARGPTTRSSSPTAGRVRGRSVVIATGARYRRLDVAEAERFEGCGIYYGATAMESELCAAATSWSSAAATRPGRGPVFLARAPDRVHIVIRRDDLAETMSRYLIRRIEETPNIHLHPRSEIVRPDRRRVRLEAVEMHDQGRAGSGGSTPRHLFLFLGALPCTDWLAGTARPGRQGVRQDRAGPHRPRNSHARLAGRRPRPCSRPACPGSTPSATSGAARSSGSPRPSAKGRSSSSSSTGPWARPDDPRICRLGRDQREAGRSSTPGSNPRNFGDAGRVQAWVTSCGCPGSRCRGERDARRISEGWHWS